MVTPNLVGWAAFAGFFAAMAGCAFYLFRAVYFTVSAVLAVLAVVPSLRPKTERPGMRALMSFFAFMGTVLLAMVAIAIGNAFGDWGPK